jgi:hypothetical protein
LARDRGPDFPDKLLVVVTAYAVAWDEALLSRRDSPQGRPLAAYGQAPVAREDLGPLVAA